MLKHRQYIYFYIFSRATLNETFTAKYDGVLPNQNSKFTPLSETTSIPTLSYAESAPPLTGPSILRLISQREVTRGVSGDMKFVR